MALIDELWLIDFGSPYPSEPAHHRPGLVVGPHAFFGDRLPLVIVCPLTSLHRGLSLHIEIDPNDENGLDQTSYVQCEALRSVAKRQLIHRLGTVDIDVSSRVGDVIAALLGY